MRRRPSPPIISLAKRSLPPNDLVPPNDLALLADECVAGSTVAALRQAGFDVEWIAEVAPGETDPAVLSRAFATGRLLLTEDKDFGDLTVRLGHQCHGVILLALTGLVAIERAARTVAALEALGDKAFGHFVVVAPRRIRLRRLPLI